MKNYVVTFDPELKNIAEAMQQIELLGVKINSIQWFIGTAIVAAEVQKITRRSKNEILSQLCQAEFTNVLINERVFEGWDADVILPDLKIAVLWNGKWHYEKIGDHNLLQVQTRDKLKLKSIDHCGYKAYVIKDMGKADETFVKEQFLMFKKSVREAGWLSDSVS